MTRRTERVDPFTNGGFARPELRRQRLADDGNRSRIGCVGSRKIASLDQRNAERGEIARWDETEVDRRTVALDHCRPSAPALVVMCPSPESGASETSATLV